MSRRRPRRLVPLLGLAFASLSAGLAAGPGMAQPVGPTAAAPVVPKPRVLRIKFQGNRRVEGETILRELITKVDDLYDPMRLQEDVRRIWRMGKFDDVKVDATQVAGGVVLMPVCWRQRAARFSALRSS